MQFTDQMGHTIQLPNYPKRIVSLVPSQTELLFDLGLEAEIVGITKFCIHPADYVKTKTKVGGTKDFKLQAIADLAPDLIIGNKEENEEQRIRELQSHFPVWMSDIQSLDDALRMIFGIGTLVGKEDKAALIVNEIDREFKRLAMDSVAQVKKTALYLIWKKPYMAAAKFTFVDEMLSYCGFENVLSNHQRYPELSETEIQHLNPEMVLLSSEPYPFKEIHIQELKKLLPNAAIRLVDGEMFSWYGSRLQYSARYFQELVSEFN